MANEKSAKSLLIVEDEPSTMRALSDKFTREGFTVLEAKDGKQGLKMAMKKRPDIVLLDILMPKMDGISMMVKLREEGIYGRSVPIVILTNISADDKIIRGVVTGQPAFYLLKADWRIEDVVKKVREALGAE